MNWRRLFLSCVLFGGCIWCLGRVESVQSGERASAQQGEAFRPVAPYAVSERLLQQNLEQLRKDVAAENPNLKKVAAHASAVAEMFNIRRHADKLPENAKSPTAGRDLAVSVMKAARAKDAAEVKKLVKQFETLPPAGDKDRASEAGAYHPVASVHDLMEIQQDEGNVVKKQLAGATPDFGKVADSSYALAELSNINRHQSDKPDYREWATQVREMSLELAALEKSNDPADARRTKARDLYRQINTTCGKCHDKYQ